MNNSKDIQIITSKSIIIKLEAYLLDHPPKFKYEIEIFYVIVNFILERKSILKNYDFVNIDKVMLSKLFTSLLDKYIKILRTAEILEVDYYEPKVKPYWYRVCEVLTIDLELINISKDSSVYGPLIKYYTNRKHVIKSIDLDSHLQIMRKQFYKGLEVDYNGAYEWINNNTVEDKRIYLMTSLLAITDKRMRYFKRNSTNNRLDTNLTNFKKELRQFIIGNYVEIDLCNSQPFFLLLLIELLIKYLNNNNIHTIPLCWNSSIDRLFKSIDNKGKKEILNFWENYDKGKESEKLKYKNSVVSGTIYEDFNKVFENCYSRKEIKELFFKVLFSKNIVKNNKGLKFEPFKKDKQVFSEVFPAISGIVEVLKRKDNSLLSVTLQKMESFIFIDCIAKELVNADIIPYTIHDSVIIPLKDQQKAVEIIKEVFSTYTGMIPKFNIKRLNE